jgi:hypothetical protein
MTHSFAVDVSVITGYGMGTPGAGGEGTKNRKTGYDVLFMTKSVLE